MGWGLEPRWSGSVPVLFNLFTLIRWDPHSFEGEWVRQTSIFYDPLTGAKNEVCSLNTPLSFWSLGTHACCSSLWQLYPFPLGLTPTYHWHLNLTGHSAKLHVLNEVYSPLPYAASAHCSRVRENSAHYLVHSSQLKIIYLLSAFPSRLWIP